MKSYLKYSIAALVIVGVILALANQHHGIAGDKVQKIDGLMNLYYDYGQFNGSILVAEKGKIIYKRGFGLAHRESKMPNESTTQFKIGSVTKQFTAMLVMQLVEKGVLKLDGKITDYLSDYPKKTGNKITIHQLLTHTSGIPNYTNLPGWQEQSQRSFTPQEFIKTFAHLDLEFEPGTRHNYSNSGYYILGVIIEKVTGQSYEKVLEEKILQPLHMKNSGYYHNNLANLATGYRKVLNRYVTPPYWDFSTVYSAGAMYSTVEDLYLWDQALYTDRLLSKKYRDLLFQPHVKTPYKRPAPPMENYYAYGWEVGKIKLGQNKNSLTIISHTGNVSNATVTLIDRIADDKHLIVLISNTGITGLYEMANAIMNILYQEPYDLPKKTISIAELMARTIEEKGIEAGLKQYRDLRSDRSGTYYLSENELNALGYELLRIMKIKEAMEVFKLNVEAYPQSFNVYDSLAEAYRANGDKELAITNYKKSLDLNPHNTNAAEMLKELAKK